MYDAITSTDSLYPSLLKEIPDAPKILYFKGNWSADLFDNCLGVVGSRKMSIYGKRVIQKNVKEIAACGITIVSGFMYGVDAEAHKNAIVANGKTIAVMPCGIDCIHPEDQQILYEQILDSGGLIVSEYEGTLRPQIWMYPRRNRVVAGLCKALLVVEAGSASGSLITARLSKKFNRPVFAVPGSIFSETSQGIFELLLEGAFPFGKSQDILNLFAARKAFDQVSLFSDIEIPSLEGDIYKLLKSETLSLDELARYTSTPIDQMGSVISIMELSGFVCEEGGKYYAN